MVEIRDRQLQGHSLRVANYTKTFIQFLLDQPSYNSILNKADIELGFYSGLLHDIGKISVSGWILKKNLKFSPHQLLNFKLRIEKLKNKIISKKFSEFSSDTSKETYVKDLKALNDSIKQINVHLNNLLLLVNESIEISSPNNIKKVLKQIDVFKNLFNVSDDLLKKWELSLLTIDSGSLCEEEMSEIQKHSESGYNILKDMSWPSHLKALPEIVYSHHERINGSGYPRKLKGDQIHFVCQVLSICDIYDALSSRDRVYKKAFTVEEIQLIFLEMVKKRELDGNLVSIFIKNVVPIFQSSKDIYSKVA